MSLQAFLLRDVDQQIVDKPYSVDPHSPGHNRRLRWRELQQRSQCERIVDFDVVVSYQGRVTALLRGHLINELLHGREGSLDRVV